MSPGLRNGQNGTSAPIRRLNLVNKLAGTLRMRVVQEILAFLASMAGTTTFYNLLAIWTNYRGRGRLLVPGKLSLAPMEDHDSFLVFSGRFATFERVRAQLWSLLILLHWIVLASQLLLVTSCGLRVKADVQLLHILEDHIFQSLLLIVLRGSRRHSRDLIAIFDASRRSDLLLRENVSLGNVGGQ